MPPPQAHYPQHSMHTQPSQHYGGAPHTYVPPPLPGPQIKSEPIDSRYVLSQPPGYTLPSLPGPQIAAASSSRPAAPTSSQSVLSFPAGSINGQSSQAPTARPYAPAPSAPQQSRVPQVDGSSSRIPQVDGPSSSGSGSASPPSFAPRSVHPSLPQPSQSQSTEENDPEAINSDLDDSDTENEEEAEEGGQAVGDIVFCTYDKVRGSRPGDLVNDD
jgi:transcription initiation factor TFIIA large subunit